MERLSTELLVDRLKRLPALPAVISELLTSFDNDDVDVDHIARQIARDQGLTARLLRVANSSFYGLQKRIATINEAVVVLGFRTVRGMAVGTFLGGSFRPDSCPGFDLPIYVRHSVGVGLAARALARETGQNGELAFTCGILHDIGKLVLAACFPEEYSRAMTEHGTQDAMPIELERQAMGVDHAEVGGLLADTWHFPAALREVVADHHNPPLDGGLTLRDVVQAADLIARGYEEHGVETQYLDLDPAVRSRLGLDDARLARVLARLDAEMEQACNAFSS